MSLKNLYDWNEGIQKKNVGKTGCSSCMPANKRPSGCASCRVYKKTIGCGMFTRTSGCSSCRVGKRK